MDFSFGIITLHDGDARDRVVLAYDSIRALDIPNWELLVSGPCQPADAYITDPHVRFVHFDDAAHPGWITRKKNLLVRELRYPFACLMHDYFRLDPGWYVGYLRFTAEHDWDVCTNPQVMPDGTRYLLDWTGRPGDESTRFFPQYWDWTQADRQYISGQFLVARTQVLRECPLDERLHWNEAEDVEWSERVRRHHPLRCNPYSVAHLTKESRSLGFVRHYNALGWH